MPDPCGKAVIAYYKFDRSYRDFCHGHNGQKRPDMKNYIGGRKFKLISVALSETGVLNGAAKLSNSEIRVPSLSGYRWGSKFSVSLWFKQNIDWFYKTKGLINNGVVKNGSSYQGSWELRIRDSVIGASLKTSQSAKTWFNVATTVSEFWQHIAMTYDGVTVNFYLNSQLKLSDSQCCHGNIASSESDVVIGSQFEGLIDEIKLFNKALTASEVTQVYQLKTV